MGSQSSPSPDPTTISTALQDALIRYAQRHPQSLKHHQEALLSLPGGNTRSLLHENPFPVLMARGESHLLHDVDGHTYNDLVGELTAGLFGHSHPVLLQALADTAKNVGLSLGATNVLEARYARLLCERFALGRVRFTNSGTEANLHALAAARKYTGRKKVVVFTGGYHGSVLSFGAPTENNVDKDSFVLVEYNDCDGVVEAFRREGSENIAAVLVEPMQGSSGFIPATKEFLLSIQEQCAQAGAVFILDEVMTSRLAPGGLQSTFRAEQGSDQSLIKPGLTTFGKYLGGGMPFGAFGGDAEIMGVYDPRSINSLVHSGTFQNNTLMLAMGHAALSQVYTPEKAISHTQRGDRLRARLVEVTKGTMLSATGFGSLVCMHFGSGWGRLGEQVRSKEHGGPDDEDLKTLFWLEMLERGFWVQRRGNIALILDTPLDVDDKFVDAVSEFVARHEGYVRIDS
ncbi:pyridoxal phosphate-dependent transferase [Microdochium trichocladiopsis]|uniref:Pyridoxal phosphate-dependent transferase n=1 Tax=Microdochium trichocladiopsis TaxID=1682393 RepID=A0A9P8Y6H6_9PEZI|nr:pyridoxal phosphate-dependent transferase [Microdochium trichocladiopsis]KAH7029046.1 pyridoxal phosphate-dependent transferase [Microdochium trichocladiopsis]